MNGTGIIYMDDDCTATAALFGKPLRATQDYISSTVQNYVQSLGSSAVGFQNQIMNRFHEISNNVVLQQISNMRNRLNSVWQTNSIRPLTTIEAIQQAPVAMQRWVMAAPVIRASWNRDGCSGYDGKYIDVRPGGVGPSHYDYRRVMDGVVEGDSYTNYREVLLNEEDVLGLLEKAAIRHTWSVINASIEDSSIDVTSPYNEMLG